MSEWREVRVGDVFEVNPLRPISKGSLTPFIPMDALSQHGRAPVRIDKREFTGSGARFQNGDTLLARITPCLENGKTSFIQDLPEGLVAHGSTEYIVVTGKPNVTDNLFSYYLARSERFRSYAIGHMEGTSGRQRVPSSAIEDFIFNCPSYIEQRTISHILGALDDKIELNHRTNQTLEAMAQVLFKDWLIDFGPTRAKMEGREPYLKPDLWAQFPDKLDKVGKPEGWQLTMLSDLVEVNPTEKLPKGTLAPYVDMASLPTTGTWSEPPVLREFGSGMKFRNNDTLLARITPCLENGKTALVQNLPDSAVGWGSTEFIVMRSKGTVPAEFVYLLARSTAFRECAIRSMTGTSGRQRAQASVIGSYPLWKVDDRIWLAFGELVAPWFQAIKANAEEAESLAKIRDLLLPKLLSKELRSEDAKAWLGDQV